MAITGVRSLPNAKQSTDRDARMRAYYVIACTFPGGCVFTTVLLGYLIAFRQGVTPPSHPWPLVCLPLLALSLLQMAFRRRIAAWPAVLIVVACSLTAAAIWFELLLGKL